LVVRVEEGVHVDKPLQIIVLCKKEIDCKALSSKQDFTLSLRVELERGAQLTVVHCIDSDMETEASVQGAVRLELAPAARLSWLSLQNINNRCRVTNDLQADVAAGAGLHTCFCSLNGGFLQNDQQINLNGVQAEASALGLYLVDGTQKVNNRVKINHNSPEARSRQLFKGILDDSASGRFEGHVLVASGAQKTEAYQTNRNLLLTKKAKFQTKPYLEIYADDVKCSHGATVGQLDEKALFYMRCRGISQATARRLLMYAFAAEVIREIGVAPLEDHLTRLVQRRLHGELAACEDCALHCTATKACANLPW
ncbi:MAG: Fe-S cluster assembly protein SufD, partial [Bacteroidales bacterium]|nr:Fe-S cluster assembly protein SufD [Bacteroidales bacterium]